MNSFSLIRGCGLACALFAYSLAANAADKQEAVTIPLEQIWAYKMPGTRNVETLDARGSLVEQIVRALADPPAKGKQARACFAVLGTGLEALREAHVLLAKGEKPHERFPAGSEICVVFSSYRTGSYVHLHKVERRGNNVEIYYRFVPHRTRNMTVHFAVIPLGKLPRGKVSVQIIQSPMEQRFVEWGLEPLRPDWAERVVCKSFFFAVVEDNGE
ncbi:MAG: hypothetical protein WD738_10995 [Pirellulales bacterium]